MKIKTKTMFVCQSCGHISARWLGRCPECESWNSLVEELDRQKKIPQRGFSLGKLSQPERLAKVTMKDEVRTTTDIHELDHVLGVFIQRAGFPDLGSQFLIQFKNFREFGRKIFILVWKIHGSPLNMD